MNARSTKAVVVLALLLALLAPAQPVHAVEITIVTSREIAAALELGLGSEFEEATGHKLRVITGDSAEFVQRIHAGEPFDIAVAPALVIDRLAESGRAMSDTKTALVRSRMGVAVRAGASKPDLSSIDAFKRALLGARSVGYLATAGVPPWLERIGLAQAIAPKAVVPQAGTVCERVAGGDVELGVAMVAEILSTPGVELAGPIPPGVQFWIVFAAAVLTNAPEPRAARELIEFLARSKAHPFITAHGLQPA